MKKRGAGIGKGSPLFLRSLAVCVFRPAIPQRSLPSVALSALPDEVVTFPIPSAKVQQLFDICKLLGKKMRKYVVKHKKEPPKGPLFDYRDEDHAASSAGVVVNSISDPLRIVVPKILAPLSSTTARMVSSP